MATLSLAERKAVWAEFMQTNKDTYGTLSKSELRSAVDAIDQFLEDNAATINAAIPQPARGALSTQQKARLLMAVVQRRFLNS